MKRKTRLILLLIIALGGAAWVAVHPKPVPPPILLHPTTRQVAQAETHLETWGQAASRPGTGPRTLRFSENDLNVYLAGSPPARQMLAAHSVQAVQITFLEPTEIVVDATVLVRHHPQNMEIRGALAPDPKLKLRFMTTHAQLGPLPLPAALVAAQVNALAARFLRRLPIEVQSVRVQKKELVIIGLPVKLSPQSKSPGHR